MSLWETGRELFYNTFTSPDKIKYHGLLNQGATCYLNSVLQVLFMTKDFREAVERNACENPEYLDDHLKDLFDNLKRHTAYTYKITNKLGINTVYEQRDAAEYFEKILTQTSPDASQIFHGQLTHKNICSQCKTEKSTDSRFWHLPLALMDSNSEEYRVVDGIEDHFRDSYFSGQDRMYCEQCDAKADAVIKCEVKHHPEVLVLLLKRFEFDYSYMRYVKNNRVVNVPYVLQIPEKQTYELYAVVDHAGDLRGGHYAAIIKTQDDDKWYNFNDTSVTSLDHQPFQVDKTEKSQSAYLLFYRKQENHAANACSKDISKVSTNGGFLPATSENYDQSQDAENVRQRDEVEEDVEKSNDTAEAALIDTQEETEINDKVNGGSRGEEPVKPEPKVCYVEDQDNVHVRQKVPHNEQYNPENETDQGEIVIHGEKDMRRNAEGDKQEETLPRETQIDETADNQDTAAVDGVKEMIPHDFKPELSDRNQLHDPVHKQHEVNNEQKRLIDVTIDKDNTVADKQSEKALTENPNTEHQVSEGPDGVRQEAKLNIGHHINNVSVDDRHLKISTTGRSRDNQLLESGKRRNDLHSTGDVWDQNQQGEMRNVKRRKREDDEHKQQREKSTIKYDSDEGVDDEHKHNSPPSRCEITDKEYKGEEEKEINLDHGVRVRQSVPHNEKYNPENKVDQGEIMKLDDKDTRRNAEGDEQEETLPTETQIEETADNQDTAAVDCVKEMIPHDFKPEISNRNPIYDPLHKQHEMSNQHRGLMDVMINKDNTVGGKTRDDLHSIEDVWDQSHEQQGEMRNVKSRKREDDEHKQQRQKSTIKHDSDERVEDEQKRNLSPHRFKIIDREYRGEEEIIKVQIKKDKKQLKDERFDIKQNKSNDNKESQKEISDTSRNCNSRLSVHVEENRDGKRNDEDVQRRRTSGRNRGGAVESQSDVRQKRPQGQRQQEIRHKDLGNEAKENEKKGENVQTQITANVFPGQKEGGRGHRDNNREGSEQPDAKSILCVKGEMMGTKDQSKQHSINRTDCDIHSSIKTKMMTSTETQEETSRGSKNRRNQKEIVEEENYLKTDALTRSVHNSDLNKASVPETKRKHIKRNIVEDDETSLTLSKKGGLIVFDAQIEAAGRPSKGEKKRKKEKKKKHNKTSWCCISLKKKKKNQVNRADADRDMEEENERIICSDDSKMQIVSVQKEAAGIKAPSKLRSEKKINIFLKKCFCLA